MHRFHYNFPPSIKHTTENRSNDNNQKNLKTTKEVKMAKNNDQRTELKLIANNN